MSPQDPGAMIQQRPASACAGHETRQRRQPLPDPRQTQMTDDRVAPLDGSTPRAHEASVSSQRYFRNPTVEHSTGRRTAFDTSDTGGGDASGACRIGSRGP